MTATLRPHLPDFTPGNVTAAALASAREAAERLAEISESRTPSYEQQLKNAEVKAYVWEKTS